MKYWKIAGIALVVVIAAALVTGSLAFAQSDDPDPNADGQTEQAVPDGWPKRTWGFDGMRGGRMGRGGLRGRGGMMDETFQEAVAEALGLTPEKLQAELDAGKRLPEIADELGVEQADLKAALSAARTAQIEQAVVDGKITQEQAEQMLERMAKSAELAEALSALRTAQIDQALADGVITKEQADLLAASGGDGFLGCGGMRGARMGRGGHWGRSGMQWGFPPRDS